MVAEKEKVISLKSRRMTLIMTSMNMLHVQVSSKSSEKLLLIGYLMFSITINMLIN